MKRSGLLATLTFALAAAVGCGPARAESSEIKAWIEVRSSDRLHTFTALAGATGEAEIRYDLLVIKEGPSGRSRTRQGGRHRLVVGENAQLSTTTLGLDGDDTYCLVLRVYRDGDVASMATLAEPDSTEPCPREQ